jgi:hypothetical protein
MSGADEPNEWISVAGRGIAFDSGALSARSMVEFMLMLINPPIPKKSPTPYQGWTLLLLTRLDHATQAICNDAHHAAQYVDVLEAEAQHEITVQLEKHGWILRCAIRRSRAAVDDGHFAEE